MPTSTSDPLIRMRSGEVYTLSLISRLIALEDAGVRFTRQPDGSVKAGPRAAMTFEDVAWLKQHRDDVRRAVADVEAECARPL